MKTTPLTALIKTITFVTKEKSGKQNQALIRKNHYPDESESVNHSQYYLQSYAAMGILQLV